jgi:hypothetical protein
MQRVLPFLLTICICIVLTVPVLAAESVRVCRQANSMSTDYDMLTPAPAVDKDAKSVYNGTLRVHVVEPASRWQDYDYRNYENAFLSLAIDTVISVPYLGTVNISKVWNGNAFGFGDVTEGNIRAIAAVYEEAGHLQYSHPETNGNPYYAHYVDAAASATPGTTGYNTTTANSTHTIYIEEASATW